MAPTGMAHPDEAVQTVPFGTASRFLLACFRPYRGRLVWSTLFHLIEMMPHLAYPIVTMFIVDYLIPAQDKGGVFTSLAAIVVLLGITAFFFTAYRGAWFQTLMRVSRDLRNQIVRRLQILSLAFHDHNHTGRYFSKIMTDVERTQGFADTAMQSGVSILGMSAVSCVILATVNWRIMLLILAFAPAFQVVRWIFRHRMQVSRRNARVARENLSATVSNFLQSSLLARMHGHEGYENRKVDDSNKVNASKAVDATADVALFSVVNTSCTVFFHFLIMAFCAVAVMEGRLSFGEMLLFNAYSNRMMSHLQQLFNLYPQVTVFCESVTSIKEIIDAPDIEYNQGKRKVEAVAGRVGFDRVSFAYSHEAGPVLREVTLDVEPGMRVGLVGRSGSGKSTFVNLLLGLYRTEQGVVSVDGMPINSLDMRTVRRQIGVVSQDPVLFSGTILENIVHAYQDTPLEEVVEAARKANAHEFISRLPEGYESPVGEGGTLLSGGQKQRIALARTFLRKPAILVLDEATSALDSESERLVQEAIERLSERITTFIIAHRLSTVRQADLILVFREGEIVERGTHDELLAQHGEYANLLMYQSFDAAQPVATPVPVGP